MIPIFSPAKKARQILQATAELFTGKDFGTEIWFAGDKHSKGYFCKVDTTLFGEELVPVLINPTQSYLVDALSGFRALDIDSSGNLLSSPFTYGLGISTFDRNSAYTYHPVYEALAPEATGGFLAIHLVEENSGKDLYSGGSVVHNIPTGAIAKIFSSSYPSFTFLAQGSYGSFKAICNISSLGNLVFITFLHSDGHKVVLKGSVTDGSIPATSISGVTEVFCSDTTNLYGVLNSSYPANVDADLPLNAGRLVKLDSTGNILLTSDILADFILLICDTHIESFLNVIVLNHAGSGKYKQSSVEVLQINKLDLTVIRSFPVNCSIPYAGTIGADSYGYVSAGSKVLRIPPPPNPAPSIPYTDGVYSPVDSRIYGYSKPSQKLYIFSSSLSLISEVQTDWGTTFDWSTMLVSDSGLILFQKYGAGSAGHIYTYDPITDSLGLFSDGQPQAVSIYTEGDYVYKAYFWYTVNTVTRLNLKTSEVLASTPVSNTLNLAITVFDNAVWVLSTGYGRDYMTIDKLSMDLQTVLASYPVPNSAGYQSYPELKLANGKLWFTTYSFSPTTSIILRSFNPTTEVFESYSDAKLNIGQAEVLGNYLYLMSMTGTFRFNLTTNTFEASDVVGSTGLIPRTTTNTNVVVVNNSAIALV